MIQLWYLRLALTKSSNIYEGNIGSSNSLKKHFKTPAIEFIEFASAKSASGSSPAIKSQQF